MDCREELSLSLPDGSTPASESFTLWLPIERDDHDSRLRRGRVADPLRGGRGIGGKRGPYRKRKESETSN